MKVYKYRYGSKRDLVSLEQDYFYAPHPSELNDPFENLFDTEGVEQILDKLAAVGLDSTKGVSEHFSNLVVKLKEVGIYSLSKTAQDELLWAYYADSHEGFCIEYDLEKLGELSKFAGSFDVTYQDSLPKIQFDMFIGDKNIVETLKLTAGTKSKAWLHEDEIRIVMDKFGKVEYDFRAVKAIYFALKMPKTHKDLRKDNKELPFNLSKVCQEQVMDTLKGRGIKYYQMLLKPNSYQFEYVEIEDLFKDSPKYKSNIKSIDKSLIDYNDYGWGVEKQYFDKVAEVIRCDPYFEKLDSIFISSSESKSRNEPIIYVGFYRSGNDLLPNKRYWTLTQIDELYKEINL